MFYFFRRNTRSVKTVDPGEKFFLCFNELLIVNYRAHGLLHVLLCLVIRLSGIIQLAHVLNKH